MGGGGGREGDRGTCALDLLPACPKLYFLLCQSRGRDIMTSYKCYTGQNILTTSPSKKKSCSNLSAEFYPNFARLFTNLILICQNLAPSPPPFHTPMSMYVHCTVPKITRKCLTRTRLLLSWRFWTSTHNPVTKIMPLNTKLQGP